MSVAWYWSSLVLNPLADLRDVRMITSRINGGTSGLADRDAIYERALAVLR